MQAVTTAASPAQRAGCNDRAEYRLRCRLRRWCTAFLALSLTAASAGQERAGPREFLEHERDLRPHANGQVWLASSERRLREHLGGLEETRGNLVKLKAWLDERVERNRVAWVQSRAQLETLQQTLQALPSGDAKRGALERQRAQLQRQGVEPRALGAVPEVRARLIELTNLQSKLILAALAIRELTPQLDVAYQRLAQDREVVRALQQLGAPHRLGPLNTNYRAELARLGEYERLVFTDSSPLYWQGRGLRVGAILNERTPIVFAWESASGPPLLTTGMVEAAGLTIPAEAPRTRLTLPDGRQFETRTLTVPAIRLGQHLVRDLPVQVLPPEGEDLGAQFGPRAFEAYHASAEPERLQFVLQPK